MATLFTDTFESDTAGSLPSGLVAATWIGGGVGTDVVSTSTPIFGAKSIEQTPSVGGKGGYYNGSGLLGAQEILFAYRYRLSGSAFVGPGAVLRSDGSSNGFLFFIDGAATPDALHLLNINGYGSLGTTSAQAILGRACVDGDIVWIRAQAIGSAIRVRIWFDGTSEPSTWSLSVTSALYATGYPGWFTNSSLAQPCVIDNVTVTDGVSLDATDSGLIYIGRWATSGSRKQTIRNGAECRFSYTGNVCTLVFDVTGVTKFPMIVHQVDNGAWTRTMLTATGSITLAPTYNTAPSGAPAYSSIRSNRHFVRFMASVDSEYPVTHDNWTSLRDAVKFQGVLLDGGTLLSLPTNPNLIEFYGDSITAGLRLLYTTANLDGPPYNAPELNWTEYVSQLLGLVPIVNASGGQGITATGTDGTPIANTAFNLVYAGATWAPTHKPAVVVVYMGNNDGLSFTAGQYQTLLATIRSAYPLAYIFAVTPYLCVDTRNTAIAAAVTAIADARILFLDYSAALANTDTSDGVHLNPGGAVKLGMKFASDIQAQLTTSGVTMQPAGGGGSVFGGSVVR